MARSIPIFVAVAIAGIHPGLSDDIQDDARFDALARLVRAAHTTDLPAVDRVEVLALSSTDVDDDVRDPQLDNFLVRPASSGDSGETATLRSPEISVTPHSAKELFGKDATRIADDWRSLEFEPNGALCHVPTYGLRFFHDGEVIFSVSVCWKCHNFYIPVVDPQTGRISVALYGFDNNAAAKKLLNDLRRLLPHPVIPHPRIRQ